MSWLFTSDQNLELFIQVFVYGIGGFICLSYGRYLLDKRNTDLHIFEKWSLRILRSTQGTDYADLKETLYLDPERKKRVGIRAVSYGYLFLFGSFLMILIFIAAKLYA